MTSGSVHRRGRRRRRVGDLVGLGVQPGRVGREVLGQPACHRLGGHRPGQAVALHQVAVELSQQPPARLVLDTLGDDPQPQVVAEADDRADDREVVVALGQVPHERAVDLHLVHRQAAQPGQRRVAGAEVVDRDEQAEVDQPLQRVHRPLRVGDDRALGDLQLEQRWPAGPACTSSRATVSASSGSSRLRIETLTAISTGVPAVAPRRRTGAPPSRSRTGSAA